MAGVKVWHENPRGTAPVLGLYSNLGGVTGGSLLFIAGQVSVGAKGEIVGKNDFTAQFHQVFKNIGDVLKGAGADFNSIVKLTTFLVHAQDIEKFMAARNELFPKIFKNASYPPNTLLIIDRLVKEEFLLEVEAVAGVASK